MPFHHSCDTPQSGAVRKPKEEIPEAKPRFQRRRGWEARFSKRDGVKYVDA